MELGKKVNINIQGNEDTHVDVNILLGKSPQYHDLLDQLNTHQKLFDRTPEDEMEERLEISKKINDLKDLIEQFKKDILQLAQAFQNIEINTDRLRRAKEFFDQGEFGEARAVFEMEIEQMQNEKKWLLEQKNRFENDILPKLKHNSEEFFLFANVTQIDYQNPNRYKDVCNYYISSIESYPNKSNVFQFAFFLQKNNQFKEAENYYYQLLNTPNFMLSEIDKASTLNNLGGSHWKLYEYDKTLNEIKEALKIYRNLEKNNPKNYLSEIAAALNNLGLLHSDQNNHEEALIEFKEALQIRRSLAEIDSNTYLPYVALVLNNLAQLHWRLKNYDDAMKELNEALQIRRIIAEVEPHLYLPDLAQTLTNLAVLLQTLKNHDKALENYEEALKIRRDLAEANPNAYLNDVAITLNNLGALHAEKKEFNEAFLKFEEAAEIYRKLKSQDFQTYFPSYAMNLMNLAIFFQQEVQQKEKSVKYSIESMSILLPFIEHVPFVQEYYVKVWIVLLNWGLSDEEIDSLIKNKTKKISDS